MTQQTRHNKRSKIHGDLSPNYQGKYAGKRPKRKNANCGKTVIVPVIKKDTGTLRLSKINSTSVLVKSTFGVPETTGNEIPAKREEPEAVIVPMLAFDRSGSRLG